MWAVIGVWKIAPSLLDELRALVPAMAEGKVGMPGFLHGTWTLDGHVMQVFAEEQSARRYHGDMLAQGAVGEARPAMHRLGRRRGRCGVLRAASRLTAARHTRPEGRAYVPPSRMSIASAELLDGLAAMVGELTP